MTQVKIGVIKGIDSLSSDLFLLLKGGGAVGCVFDFKALSKTSTFF